MAEVFPGAQLGRYRLVGRLRAGSMGEVWDAELLGPMGFRKPVALKLLRAGPTAPSQKRSGKRSSGRSCTTSTSWRSTHSRSSTERGSWSWRWAKGTLLRVAGALYRDLGQRAEARELLGSALSLLRQAGDRGGEGIAEADLGIMDRQEGHLEEAQRRYERALAIARERVDRRAEGARSATWGSRARPWGTPTRRWPTTRQPWRCTERSATGDTRESCWPTWGSPTTTRVATTQRGGATRPRCACTVRSATAAPRGSRS